MKTKAKYKITIEGGVNVWPHELHTAKAFINAGYNVTFIPAHNSVTSADAYINNTICEFKSPEGSTVRCIERNIVNALNHQSNCIAIDSVRMKNIQDRSIKNFLIRKRREGRGIKQLYFVTRDGKLIDINKLV